MPAICHVQVLPLMSGVQRSMLELLRHLDPDEFTPHVVCQSEGPLTEELSARGIRWHCVPELRRSVHPLRDYAAYRRLVALFQREQFALVHNQSAKPRAVAGPAARRAGVPAIINHVRGYPFHAFSPRWQKVVYRRAERFVARFCDRTLFVCDEDRRTAVRDKLVSASRAETIYNGADLAAFSEAEQAQRRAAIRARWNLDEETIAITVLGRLEPQKQPTIVPQIAAALRERPLDRRWCILLAGDGSLEDTVRDQLETLGLSQQVRLLGWQKSPAEVLAGSDVALLPSLWEGLPRGLIEAHAAGLPCVASDISGNREVVHRETGTLCPPQEAAGYAAALAELIENPFKRRVQGLAARQRAVKLFDTHANNLAIIEVYRRLLNLPQRQAIEPGRAAA